MGSLLAPTIANVYDKFTRISRKDLRAPMNSFNGTNEMKKNRHVHPIGVAN